MLNLHIVIPGAGLGWNEADFHGVCGVGNVDNMNACQVERTEPFVERAQVGVVSVCPDIGDIRAEQVKV